MKEKEHEIYFLEQIKNSRWLPFFEKIFAWGRKSSLNDVDFQNKYSVEEADRYCRTYGRDDSGRQNESSGLK